MASSHRLEACCHSRRRMFVLVEDATEEVASVDVQGAEHMGVKRRQVLTGTAIGLVAAFLFLLTTDALSSNQRVLVAIGSMVAAAVGLVVVALVLNRRR